MAVMWLTVSDVAIMTTQAANGYCFIENVLQKEIIKSATANFF